MSKPLYELNGWIDRNGKIHYCPPNGHKQKAEELKSSELLLEKAGWVKIYSGHFLMSDKCPYRPASYQSTTIWDLCKKYDRPNIWEDFCNKYANK